MDVEILSRVQFALTIMFHYIYPPLSIGLGLILVIIEGFYLKTRNPFYLQMAKFWTKVFALTFAMGVATGIVMEFEFGTNWATYSRYVGDVFGSALAAEGIFAFFLESGFLAILLFGWDRVGPKMHFFSTLMVCLGAHFSAIWIIVANSWMQTPAGFHVVGEGLKARAEITDFWAMVLNPSSVDRLLHSVIGAWLAGAFLVISVAAYYLLKKRHLDFAKSSLKIGLVVGLTACILQVISGDSSGKVVAKYQPAKLAALEGIFHTQKEAPLTLFGIVNMKEERLDYAVKIPHLLSFLSFGATDAEVKGLDQVPKKDWPNVSVVFQMYHLMILMWVLMFALSIVAVYLWHKGSLFSNKWVLRALVASVFFPQIANQAGWVAAEMGRYPWIVYNLLRISDGLSKSVTASAVLGSLIMFTILYFLLFLVFIYLLNEKFKHGPIDTDGLSPYSRIKKEVYK
ncbi:MAG: cytochrome ubiquinol oxidase subunit I [Parachlamydiaceae bacterium]